MKSHIAVEKPRDVVNVRKFILQSIFRIYFTERCNKQVFDSNSQSFDLSLFFQLQIHVDVFADLI